MTCKAMVPVLAFIFVWGNLAPGRALAQTPPWASPFRRDAPPPAPMAPAAAEAPKPAPPMAEPPRQTPPPAETPPPPSPAPARAAKSRVLVCPHLAAPGTPGASAPAGPTYCLSREKAGQLADDTLVLVARVEEGTNRLVRFALTYRIDMEDLDFWSDAPEVSQKHLESALDEGERVQSVGDGGFGLASRGGGPGPLRGLGSVVPMADVAVAAVLTVIADLAVSKAKALALDIARDQVIEACDRLRERGVMAHLCARFRNEPLLDLIKDRKVLQAAVVADALDYVAARQAQAVPAALQPAVEVVVGILREAAASGRVPRPDALRGLWEALQRSLETLDPEGGLGSLLWVSTTLMITALETGAGPAVLEWSVFRDFREPSPSDRKYLAAYLGAMAWAAGVLEEKWPVPCAGKDEAGCRAARQARVDQLDFTLEDFGLHHPQYLLERGVYDRLDQVVRWRDFHDPGVRKLYDRFRVLLQEPEPRVWLREALALLFEVLEREKRERLDALAALDGKGEARPLSLDDLASALHAVTALEEAAKRAARPLAGLESATCRTAGARRCRQVRRVGALVRLLRPENGRPSVLARYREVAGPALAQYRRTLGRNLDAEVRRELRDQLCGELTKAIVAHAELVSRTREALRAAGLRFDGAAALEAELERLASLISPAPGPARGRLEAELARLGILRRLVFAVAEGDHAMILRGFIDLLQSGEAALPRGLRTGVATLRLIIGLIEPDAPGEKPDQAQKRRVALLQEFADQMTSRRGRHREWIASLGVSAFAGGGVSWSGDGGGGAFSPVSLPLGVSFQWYAPSGHGFHLMAYPLDVAQYARVDASGDEAAVPSPSFYTALTFGLQLAWARLLRDVPFTIGLDLRYIPYLAYDERHLLEDGTEETVTRTRRHFQIMGFVGFHFPVLDFN